VNRRLLSMLGAAAAVAIPLSGGMAFAVPPRPAPAPAPLKMKDLLTSRVGSLSLLSLPPALEKRLKLTPAQKTRLAEIRRKLRASARPLAPPTTATQISDRRASLLEMRAAREKAETESLAVLTAEQRRQFDALTAETKRYPGLGVRVNTALLCVTGLTPAQKKKLEQLSASVQAKRREAVGGLASQNGKMMGFRSFFLVDQQATEDARKLLTPNQQKEFQSALDSLKGPRPATPPRA